MAEHQPACGRSELSPCFTLLACVAFALAINLSLSQHMSFGFFFHFYSSDSVPDPMSEGVSSTELPSEVKPQHT